MNKQMTIEEAVAKVTSGSTIMVGGFGSPGTPFSLLKELLRQGQTDLTLIKNDANEETLGISELIEKGRVSKLITTHIGLNKKIIQMMNAQELEVEFHPQGILAEKIRTAGAGSFGFLSDIGLHSEITKPEDLITWKGKTVKVESALLADFAFIHARKADLFGNLVYRATAMNFNPLMAMAADDVIVETGDVVSVGDLNPETIHTPSAFVSSVVKVDVQASLYDVMEGRYECE